MGDQRLFATLYRSSVISQLDVLIQPNIHIFGLSVKSAPPSFNHHSSTPPSWCSRLFTEPIFCTIRSCLTHLQCEDIIKSGVRCRTNVHGRNRPYHPEHSHYELWCHPGGSTRDEDQGTHKIRNSNQCGDASPQTQSQQEPVSTSRGPDLQ